jgi:hypothetical protein
MALCFLISKPPEQGIFQCDFIKAFQLDAIVCLTVGNDQGWGVFEVSNYCQH